MVWKEVPISVDFPVETLTLGDFSWYKQFNMSVSTAAARIRLPCILPHAFNISCFLFRVSEWVVTIETL